MKGQLVVPSCVLLLWTLTAFVSCAEEKHLLKLIELADGVKLSCGNDHTVASGNGAQEQTMILPYKDENTGEYSCLDSNSDKQGAKMFVKFRTCDNCVEIDMGVIAGIVVGEVVATIGVGVAIYLVASIGRTGPVTSNKKSSDRQPLTPHEAPRASNDHYQPLRPKPGQKDTYDVLHPR